MEINILKNSLVFNPDKVKESNFIQIDNSIQFLFDMKNNVHILTKDSYEL